MSMQLHHICHAVPHVLLLPLLLLLLVLLLLATRVPTYTWD
jgi:hypothetical protein